MEHVWQIAQRVKGKVKGIHLPETAPLEPGPVCKGGKNCEKGAESEMPKGKGAGAGPEMANGKGTGPEQEMVKGKGMVPEPEVPKGKGKFCEPETPKGKAKGEPEMVKGKGMGGKQPAHPAHPPSHMVSPGCASRPKAKMMPVATPTTPVTPVAGGSEPSGQWVQCWMWLPGPCDSPVAPYVPAQVASGEPPTAEFGKGKGKGSEGDGSVAQLHSVFAFCCCIFFVWEIIIIFCFEEQTLPGWDASSACCQLSL